MLNITQDSFNNFYLSQINKSNKPQKKKISSSFIYSIPKLPFESLESIFNNLSLKEFSKISNSNYYGINFFSLFVLNKDPKSLQLIIDIYKKNNIDIPLLPNEENSKYLTIKNELPFNIALRKKSLQHMKILADNNLANLNLDLKVNKYFSTNSLLLLTSFYSSIKSENLHFYYDFLLKTDNSKSLFSQNFNHDELRLLSSTLLHEPFFLQDDYIKILPKILEVSNYGINLDDKNNFFFHIFNNRPTLLLDEKIYTILTNKVNFFNLNKINIFREQVILSQSLNKTLSTKNVKNINNLNKI